MGERSPLTAAQKRRHARHVLLAEIGEPGQLRLCASRVQRCLLADPRAASVALEYLERAGMSASDAADALPLALPSSAQVRALSGHVLLEDAAASLAGAFAAVEAIKQSLGVGVRAALPSHFSLGSGAGS
jgi:hypothetical protein